MVPCVLLNGVEIRWFRITLNLVPEPRVSSWIQEGPRSVALFFSFIPMLGGWGAEGKFGPGRTRSRGERVPLRHQDQETLDPGTPTSLLDVYRGRSSRCSRGPRFGVARGSGKVT